MHPRSKHWHWLCHSTKEEQTGCQSDKDYAWCRLLNRSQACCQQTQPAHSATTTTRQESLKEIECLQAETRQQEVSIHQWYFKPLRCTGTQFRGCRWELDSLQRPRHFSAMDSQRQVSRKHQGWFDENENETQGFFEKRHQKTQGIPQRYQLIT